MKKETLELNATHNDSHVCNSYLTLPFLITKNDKPNQIVVYF